MFTLEELKVSDDGEGFLLFEDFFSDITVITLALFRLALSLRLSFWGWRRV